MILYVGQSLDSGKYGGRERLCSLNRLILFEIFGNDLKFIEINKKKITGFKKLVRSILLGLIDGLDADEIQSISCKISEQNIRKVFIDGSNFGRLGYVIKKNYPNIEVITFFHNVEARFFWGAIKARRTLRSVAIFFANYIAEKFAVKVSDKIICLSERDSRLLKEIYGRSASHISAIAIKDDYSNGVSGSFKFIASPFALFVGSTFYANQDGIAWFVRYVVPYINVPIYIIGHGFEKFRSQLEVPNKVFVVGTVDNVALWYQSAQFVIAPIFDGSGMKTKIAEALMYGKKVIGTPEAFSGYEKFSSDVGWVCRTSEEFVQAFFSAKREPLMSFNPYLRSVYLQNYSPSAARKRIKDILL